MMSLGMALIAAERIVMANPAWIQIITTISSRLFQNGDEQQVHRLEARATPATG